MGKHLIERGYCTSVLGEKLSLVTDMCDKGSCVRDIVWLLHSMDSGVSKYPGSGEASSQISDYFIMNILQNKNSKEFDFSMEQILYLCDLEPGTCQKLLDSLAASIDETTWIPTNKEREPTSIVSGGMHQNKDRRPASIVNSYHKPAINQRRPAIIESHVKSDHEMVSHVMNVDVISPKDDYSYATLTNIIRPYGKNIFQLAGLPRHVLILALLPLFPVMLLFTASGGAAFFVTTGVEWVLRYGCEINKGAVKKNEINFLDSKKTVQRWQRFLNFHSNLVLLTR